MILISKYVAEAKTPLAAYNLLQLAHIKLYIAEGGTVEEWCIRMAGPFRERYGWILNLNPETMKSFEVLQRMHIMDKEAPERLNS